MSVNVIDTIKPKNGGSFPVVEANDVKVTNTQRLDTALNAKASLTEVQALEATVADKANRTELNALASAISGKANSSDLNSLAATVELKANTSDVAAALTSKANVSDVNTALSTKASTIYVDNGLFTKANTTTTDSLQSQIDEIISPVTEDAEVQNARVGIDGTQYLTLRARLDAEIGSISEGLSNIDDSVAIILAGAGKNKCPNNIENQTTSKGVTATVYGNKTVLLTGTAYENEDAAFILFPDTIFPPGKYHISGCPAGGSVDTYRIDVVVGSNVYRDTGSGNQFTISEDTAIRANIVVYRNTTAPSDIFEPMICTLSDWQESDTYEEYGKAVPMIEVIDSKLESKQNTLNYAQLSAVNSGITSELVTTYNNTSELFNQIYSYSSKNLLPNAIINNSVSSNVTAIVNADKTVSLSGTANVTAPAVFIVASALKLPEGNYVFSGCPAGGNTNTYRVDIVTSSSVYRDTGNGVTITVNEDDEILVQLVVYQGTTAPAESFKPMICTLSDWQESSFYEPYSKRSNKTIVINVGANMEFTSLRSALEYATEHYEANTLYEVRMHYSDYDVADDFTEAELTTSSNYVGLMVTKNVRLVGADNYRNCVVRLALDSSLPESVRKRISTINLQDNAELENLTIKATKCRYAVHDDFWAEVSRKKTIKNCLIYSDDTYYHRAYGAGFRSGDNWSFKNCIFQMTDTALASFSAHNNTGFTMPAAISFENCRFIGGEYGAMFGSLTNGTSVINTITFKGCKSEAANAAVRLYEESAVSYGRGCLMSVTGYGNTFDNEDVLIQVTDGGDYSQRVDLI